jgi:hypothetical protein
MTTLFVAANAMDGTVTLAADEVTIKLTRVQADGVRNSLQTFEEWCVEALGPMEADPPD